MLPFPCRLQGCRPGAAGGRRRSCGRRRPWRRSCSCWWRAPSCCSACGPWCRRSARIRCRRVRLPNRCALHSLALICTHQRSFRQSGMAHQQVHTGAGECGPPQACGPIAKPSAVAIASAVHFLHRDVHGLTCGALMSEHCCDCRQPQQQQRPRCAAAAAAPPGQRPQGSRAAAPVLAAAAAPASRPWTSCTSWRPWTSRRAATAAAPARVCSFPRHCTPLQSCLQCAQLVFPHR